MSIPTYNPNIPKALQELANSQLDMQENFKVLSDAFQVDHVSMTTALIAGNHKVINLLAQGGDIQTAIDEISIYSRATDETADKTNKNYQLFYKNAAGVEVQLTALQIYTLSTAGRYFTFLPGNVILYFGTINSGGTSSWSLPLEPVVATTIISVNSFPIGETASTPDFGPACKAVFNDTTKLYQSITFLPATTGTPLGLKTTFSYFVLGNLGETS